MTSQTHNKKGSNLHLDKGEEENSSDPPKKPKTNPVIKFFQKIINKSSQVSDSNPSKNSSPKFKKKPKKPQKSTAGGGTKIDFGIEKTQTLGHFEKPKPPQNRSRPRTMKPRKPMLASSIDGLLEMPESEGEISNKPAWKPTLPSGGQNTVSQSFVKNFAHEVRFPLLQYFSLFRDLKTAKMNQLLLTDPLQRNYIHLYPLQKVVNQKMTCFLRIVVVIKKQFLRNLPKIVVVQIPREVPWYPKMDPFQS